MNLKDPRSYVASDVSCVTEVLLCQHKREVRDDPVLRLHSVLAEAGSRPQTRPEKQSDMLYKTKNYFFLTLQKYFICL